MWQWRRIARVVWQRWTANDLASYAAALAYNFLFALFPLLLFLTALLGFLHIPLAGPATRPAAELLPPGVDRLLRGALSTAIHRRHPALLSLGAAGFVWGMSGAFRQLMDALDHALGLSPPFRRSTWSRYLISVLAGISLGAMAAASVALAATGTWLTRWLAHSAGSGGLSGGVAAAIPWAALLALSGTTLLLAYRILPDRPPPIRSLAPGALAAWLLWLLISLAFSLYTARFNPFGMYGGIGAVIALMVYLYLLAAALLLGAEWNAVAAAVSGRKAGEPGPPAKDPPAPRQSPR